MDLRELKNYLNSLARSLEDEDKKLLSARLVGLLSVFPFNEKEFSLARVAAFLFVDFGDLHNLNSLCSEENWSEDMANRCIWPKLAEE